MDRVKICSQCKTSLPIDSFKILKNGNPHCWCINCNKKYLANKHQEYKKDPNKDRTMLGRDIIQLPESKVLFSMSKKHGVKGAAKLLNCNPMTIINRLKRDGLYKSFKITTKVAVPKKQLYDMYFNQKKSFTEIRKETGCSVWYLQNTFKKEGWQARSREDGITNAHRDFSDQHIIDTYKKFESSVAASSELGMTPQGVSHILKKHGINMTGNIKESKNGGERVVVEWLNEFGISPIIERWNDWDPAMFRYRWNHIDIYLPNHKIFIEFNGQSYHMKDHQTIDRDERKKKEFLAEYPDHKWIVITDEEIMNKSKKVVAKANLHHKFLPDPLSVKDLKFGRCTDKFYALCFLDRFHDRKRSHLNTDIFTIGLDGVIVGVATFGPPQDPESEYTHEFKRLALCPGLPANTASWFIASCTKEFAVGTKLITYIDSEHLGSCFIGANWVKIGETISKNAYHFEKGAVVIDRRKAYQLAKESGMIRSQWARINGYVRVKDFPKQIFEFIVK